MFHNNVVNRFYCPEISIKLILGKWGSGLINYFEVTFRIMSGLFEKQLLRVSLDASRVTSRRRDDAYICRLGYNHKWAELNLWNFL